MGTITLTKKLISIPSYVSKGVDENAKAEYIYQLLKNKSNLVVEKQYVEGKRFNVIAKDKYPTKLLLAGHIDTVEPKGSDTKSQLTPTIKAISYMVWDRLIC
jgi:acetylornithine deacetylase/succinyl-diaminopimelate desuccinylase-like protein